MSMWKPEAPTKCLLQPLSITRWYIKAGSFLLNLELTSLVWLVACSCLFLSLPFTCGDYRQAATAAWLLDQW